MPPKAVRTWSTIAVTANRSPMSQVATNAESRPRARLGPGPFELLAVAADQGDAQPQISARVAAMLRPIPLPAPVTSAVFKVEAKAVSSRCKRRSADARPDPRGRR